MLPEEDKRMNAIATLSYSATVDVAMYRYLAQDSCGDIYAYNSMPCIDDTDGVWCVYQDGRVQTQHCIFILCGEENSHPHVSLVDLYEHRPHVSRGLLTPGEVIPVGPPNKCERLTHTVEVPQGNARYLMQDIDGYVWTTRKKPTYTPGGYWDGFGSDEPRFLIVGLANLEPETSLVDLETDTFTFDCGTLRRVK